MKKAFNSRLTFVLALSVFGVAHAAEHKNQAYSAPAGVTSTDIVAAAASPETAVAHVLAGGAPSDAGTQTFAVRLADGNFRRMIDGWGKQAGWHLKWEIDKDIEISGETVFNKPFDESVRLALRSTESSDLPVHGCFYSNRWVRVVPLSTPCH